MGWDARVVEPADAAARVERGEPPRDAPAPPHASEVSPAALAAWLAQAAPGEIAVIDVTASANYVKRHVPGAWFAVRARLRDALAAIPVAKRYVFTCGSSLLARFAAADARALLPASAQIAVLAGGTAAWSDAGLPLEHGETRLASPRVDRYRRPYEGTDNAAAAMQAYLDWEYGLVDQLKRDGTHHFTVI
jgi:rhodanese-related sulfurtransferase